MEYLGIKPECDIKSMVIKHMEETSLFTDSNTMTNICYNENIKAITIIKQENHEFLDSINAQYKENNEIKTDNVTIIKKEYEQNDWTDAINIKTNLENNNKDELIESKKFTTSETVEETDDTVLDAKKYKCNLCSKSYKRKHSLTSHLNKHTDPNKKYTCKVCSKKFSRPDNLTTHLRHHTGKNLYECGVCLKKMVSNYQYKLHMKQHTGDRDFKCNICLKGLMSKRALIYHMNTHNGIKEFKCDSCYKKFSYPSSLDYHKRIHLKFQEFTV